MMARLELQRITQQQEIMKSELERMAAASHNAAEKAAVVPELRSQVVEMGNKVKSMEEVAKRRHEILQAEVEREICSFDRFVSILFRWYSFCFVSGVGRQVHPHYCDFPSNSCLFPPRLLF